MLVTDYVNPRLAEVMKGEGIAFIDAEGNAYIKEPPLCIFVKGNRPHEHKTGLLERWVEAYPEQLRPKMIIERFEAGSRNWWGQIDIEGFGAFWGGEVAAFKLTGYLKPERITIYTKTNPGEMVLRNKLRKDPQGEVEILTTFWDFEKARQAGDIAPPILVYADLMATGDQRNIETARIIYERYLDELVREGR